MKKKLTRLMIISCFLALLAGSIESIAQDKRFGSGEPKVPADKFKLIAAKFALGKSVKGAPYSATAITETIQTLSDGNQIIRKNESRMYRDSEGRTRNEGPIKNIGKWVADGEAQPIAFINDPVAGFTYSLHPLMRTAYKYQITDALQTLDNGMIGIKKQAAREKEGAQNSKIVGEGGKPTISTEPGNQKEIVTKDGKKRIEKLGKQVIEGVEVELTRTTLTISAGEIGNTLPIEVVDETWYSHELQMVVMSKHRDPRSGETTYRLTNISRSEPDRALFEIPADYTIKDGPGLPAKKKKPTEE